MYQPFCPELSKQGLAVESLGQEGLAGYRFWIPHGAAALGHTATWLYVSGTRRWLRRDLGVLTGLPEWSEASPAPLA